MSMPVPARVVVKPLDSSTCAPTAARIHKVQDAIGAVNVGVLARAKVARVPYPSLVEESCLPTNVRFSLVARLISCMRR